MDSSMESLLQYCRQTTIDVPDDDVVVNINLTTTPATTNSSVVYLHPRDPRLLYPPNDPKNDWYGHPNAFEVVTTIFECFFFIIIVLFLHFCIKDKENHKIPIFIEIVGLIIWALKITWKQRPLVDFMIHLNMYLDGEDYVSFPDSQDSARS